MSEMVLRIWDVEHGACAMLWPRHNGQLGPLAMIDSGDNATERWRPSQFIRHELGRDRIDYLFVTNADQDHLSDLDGLWQEGIAITTLSRNPHPPVEALRQIKVRGGGVTRDMQRFLDIHGSYNSPVTRPFNEHMGGITKKVFYNPYPRFTDTNNLSLVVFFQFGQFKVLFPGDLEADGWRALLERDDFRRELAGTTILVAAHHGRENGYCAEVFNHVTPRAIVMSDKAIVHDTQEMTNAYRACVDPDGVYVTTTGRDRRVLTTRNDGHITFVVSADRFEVHTECGA